MLLRKELSFTVLIAFFLGFLVLFSCSEEDDLTKVPEAKDEQPTADPQQFISINLFPDAPDLPDGDWNHCCTKSCPFSACGECVAEGYANCSCTWFGGADCGTDEKGLPDYEGHTIKVFVEGYSEVIEELNEEVVSKWDEAYAEDMIDLLEENIDIVEEANYEIDSEEEPELFEDYFHNMNDLDGIWEDELTYDQQEEVEDFIDELIEENEE